MLRKNEIIKTCPSNSYKGYQTQSIIDFDSFQGKTVIQDLDFLSNLFLLAKISLQILFLRLKCIYVYTLQLEMVGPLDDNTIIKQKQINEQKLHGKNSA